MTNGAYRCPRCRDHDLEGLVKFWQRLASHMFDTWGLDGGEFQDWGLEFGLLTEVVYDPEIHGDLDAEPGDTIVVSTVKGLEE